MATLKKKVDQQQQTIEKLEAELSIKYEPLSWLLAHQAPRNPKKHDAEGVSASMDRFGFTIPVALDEKTNTVVAGHGRIEVLAKRKAEGKAPPSRVRVASDGDWLVPVFRGLSFASPEEAEAYLLADNRHTEIGGYDDELLAEMLRDAREHDAGLEGLGWTEEAVTDLIALIEKTANPEEPKEPKEREAPEDFPEHTSDSKNTVHCPRCGFPVPVES